MSQTEPSRHALRVADLPQRAITPFDIALDKQETEELRRFIALDGLRKVRLTGTLAPLAKRDWRLEAKLGATVVQPCVATLEPVTTRIDTNVTREFLKDFEQIDQPEAEIPDDDSSEALGSHIDLWHVLAEALSLAVPLYPRAGTSADPVEIRITEPGKAAMTDEQAKPFAGLAALKSQLDQTDETD
jgi:uncharacterized metal-binding protein YceD (DUF177 family)